MQWSLLVDVDNLLKFALRDMMKNEFAAETFVQLKPLIKSVNRKKKIPRS